MKVIHARHLYIGTGAEMGVTTPPADAQGATFFQTDTDAMYYWDGDSWEGFGGAATDPNAIHDNVAAEISAIAEKIAPVGADILVIEDSAAANVKKKVQITNLPGGADADAIHDNVADEITAIAQKVTPVANDEFIMEDSAAAFVKKAVPFSGLEAALSITEAQISDLDHDDPEAIHDNVAAEISAVAEKVVPVGADLVLIEDSAAGNAKKKVQLTNLPAGSPSADYTYWDPMAPPASPETEDDEFDGEGGGGTPAGWTVFNPSAGTFNIYEEERGLRTNGDGTVNIQGLFKAYTPPTSQLFSICTRVAANLTWLNSGSTQKHVGLAFFEDAVSNPSTSDIWVAWLRWHSASGLGVQLAHYDDYNSLNTLHEDHNLDVPGPTGIYLMLSFLDFIEDAVQVHYSVDGRSWISVGAGDTIAFTPKEVGIVQLASGDVFHDFFRLFEPGSVTAPSYLKGQRVKRFID